MMRKITTLLASTALLLSTAAIAHDVKPLAGDVSVPKGPAAADGRMKSGMKTDPKAVPDVNLAAPKDGISVPKGPAAADGQMKSGIQTKPKELPEGKTSVPKGPPAADGQMKIQ